jgi:hypothetical protein
MGGRDAAAAIGLQHDQSHDRNAFGGPVDWHDVRTRPLISCGNPDEKGKVPGVVIQHEFLAANFPKLSGWRRYLRRTIGGRAPSRERNAKSCLQTRLGPF